MKPPKRPRIVANPEDEWEYELFQEALGLLRVPNDQNAERMIRSVIQMFKYDIEKERVAPGISDLRKTLEKIYQHSRGLARLLDDVDPYFHGAIMAYTSIDDWTLSRDPRSPNDFFPLNEFLHPLVSKSTQFKTMLSGITKGANLVLQKMPLKVGRGQNLFDLLYQSPKRLFTVRCWEIFWQFRPGEARGTPNKDFHTFCGLLYHLSTGEGAEEPGVGLLRYVRESAKVCNELLKRKPEIDGLRRALADGESTLGLISDTGLAASLFGGPQQIMNDLHKRPEKHEDQ